MPLIAPRPPIRVFRLAGLAILVTAALIRAPHPGAQTVERLVQEAEDLSHFEAFLPARTKLATALRMAQRIGHTGLIALCLDRIGLVLEFEGQNAIGIDHHARALALADKVEDRRLSASILASTGIGHWRRADYPAALESLHDALRIQEQIDDRLGQARTLDFIGRVHFKKAQYGQAEEAYHRAVRILRAAGDRRWLSITLEDVGDLALERGLFMEALDAFEQALLARTELHDVPGEVYMLSVLGRAYLQQGAHREAIAWFHRAAELSQSAGDRAGRATALYHMGLAHGKLANAVEAIDLHGKALALKQELGDRRGEAWILAAVGDAHALRRDFPSALEAYRRAARIWEEIGDPRGTATGLSKAGRITFELARYEESAALFHRASQLVDASQPAFLADALVGIGRAYAASGEGRRALEYALRAEQVARRGSDLVRWSTLRSIAWIERTLGRREDALAHYQESLTVIENIRGRVVASPDVRAGFLEGKQGVYDATVELLVELGRVEEGLEVAERSRARAFLDLLSGRDLATKPVDPATLARIAALEESLRRESAPDAPGSGRAALTGLHRGDRLRSTSVTTPASRPDLAALVTTSPSTLREARMETRRSGGTILEYFSGTNHLFMWVVTADGTIRGTALPIGRGELSELVRLARTAMGADGAATKLVDPSQLATSDARPLLRRLHQILIDPVAPFLPRDGESVITIVPHGPLFLLSFAALVDSTGRYLVERHTLAYSPSISALPYMGGKRNRLAPSAPSRLLVIGNPAMPQPRDGQSLPRLPGSEQEAFAIAALYPSARVTALVGARARERTARELIPAQTIIHLATHAVVFDNEPMDSYLALAPDLGSPSGAEHFAGDGFLTAAEVFGLDLHADLVTLSACNTGLGHVSGEGVVGLSRAFLYAGAASVLVSLWRVADSVSTVQMERFYRALIETNGDRAAALAAAQREMIALLRQGAVRSPSGSAFSETPLLWAPFVLVGEPR